MKSACGIALLMFLTTGCADEYIMYHSQSGAPLLVSRRASTYEGCLARVKDDLARLGVTARYIHVRGSAIGRSLLWPFEPGYACEAAIGPEQGMSGSYVMGGRAIQQGL